MTDPGGLLTAPARDALDARLAATEQQTGHQVLVWIGPTTGGAPLDAWAASTFAAWQVGRAGLDDGLVVFVLTEDHTIDVEVGYGLEGLVPDALAGRVVNEVIGPGLKAGTADAALTDGVGVLLQAIGAEASAPPAAAKPFTWLEWAGLGVLAAGVGLLLIRYPQAARALLIGVAMGLLRGGRSGGGGGFRGGGGRSGGGGARGSF